MIIILLYWKNIFHLERSKFRIRSSHKVFSQGLIWKKVQWSGPKTFKIFDKRGLYLPLHIQIDLIHSRWTFFVLTFTKSNLFLCSKVLHATNISWHGVHYSHTIHVNQFFFYVSKLIELNQHKHYFFLLTFKHTYFFLVQKYSAPQKYYGRGVHSSHSIDDNQFNVLC